MNPWYSPHKKTSYMTERPVSFELGFKGSGFTYTVPADFIFDVSVPRGLKWLINPHNPKYLKAAAIHDHMLVSGWDRPTAGGVFQAALKVSGVSSTKRLAMFFAVTLWKWH
jgi:hypothetical protein